jgi:hypothetical protein
MRQRQSRRPGNGGLRSRRPLAWNSLSSGSERRHVGSCRGLRRAARSAVTLCGYLVRLRNRSVRHQHTTPSTRSRISGRPEAIRYRTVSLQVHLHFPGHRDGRVVWGNVKLVGGALTSHRMLIALCLK